jgi:glucose-6-phosphate isomerase
MTYRLDLGPLADAAAAAIDEAMAIVPRIWDRDHTVWDEDPTEIADRLGWLDAPERGEAYLPDYERIVVDAVGDGITDVLLVGMGGSSLFPEVLARVFGPAAGSPRLTVLDSTDPGAVLEVERRLPWSSTLVVPASKSGTTIEMTCHLERFMERLVDAHGDAAGRYVAPITDPGSQLDLQAVDQRYRASVHGQPDVGGRYSALTPFGLFPATLLGLDVSAMLAAAEVALLDARSDDPDANAPAVLGAVMAAAARAGRDKLTILLPDEVAVFGLWIEQLVAESTGKHGLGLLPVLAERPGEVTFGDDRLVVAYEGEPAIEELVAAGVPVVTLPWTSARQLPAEVCQWEFATAVAGALLGINPFDQPNVAAAKAATTHVLATGEELPDTDDPTATLESVTAGDYLALLGYVTPGSDDEGALHAAAARLRERYGVPVTVGIGPRYLHSTGQLHKGGANTGVFLVTVGDDLEDVAIPGREFTFSRLKRAQAAGDLHALREAGRRVAHVDVTAIAGL